MRTTHAIARAVGKSPHTAHIKAARASLPDIHEENSIAVLRRWPDRAYPAAVEPRLTGADSHAGHATPVAWCGQYPLGTLCRYCW